MAIYCNFVYIFLFSYCSSEPGVLLWPFIEYLCYTYRSCGHLLKICVFYIARLSQAFLWTFIEYLCFPSFSLEPGVLLWQFIENLCILYFCIPYCLSEPGVLLWPLIEYFCIPYCSLEPGVLSLVAIY